MKFLKGLIKFIQAILLFSIPLILSYWFLSVLNLEPIKPFVAILGSMFDPFIDFIKLYLHYQIVYDNVTVDFDPLILAVTVMVLVFILIGFENIFNEIDKIIAKAKEKVRETKEKHYIEIQKMDFIEELAKNKVTYSLMKLRKKQSSFSYLYKAEEDLFGGGVFSTMVNDIINKAKELNGKIIDDYNEENGEKAYIFYNVTDAIDYAFFVHNKVNEINTEVLDQAEKLFYSFSFHCAYSEATANMDLQITKKILMLGSDDEIIVSELFKNKYEALKAESNILFESKGIYCINENEIEIFQLKVNDN